MRLGRRDILVPIRKIETREVSPTVETREVSPTGMHRDAGGLSYCRDQDVSPTAASFYPRPWLTATLSAQQATPLRQTNLHRYCFPWL